MATAEPLSCDDCVSEDSVDVLPSVSLSLHMDGSCCSSPQKSKSPVSGFGDETSVCMSISDDEEPRPVYLSSDSDLSDTGPPVLRRKTKSRNTVDDEDDDDVSEEAAHVQDLDEDYRLAVELDRAINGDWARLEQLLMNLDEESQPVEEPEPLYPVGEGLFTECQICLEDKFLHKRTCCQYPVCEECLTTYFEMHISQANVKIACPQCKSFVYRTEIFDKVSSDVAKKFNQFIVDANKNPLQKTCPRCSNVHTIEEFQLKDKIVKKYGLKVQCPECQLDWCFQCQAPLHEGMKCKVYQKGEKLVKEWANEMHGEQANARRCPKCKIWIQRSSGCDHMTCNQCNAQFCYRCGGRYVSLKFLGSHHSKWSIFGCKNNFLPNRPVARRLTRGSIFAGQVVGGLVLGGLAVAVAGAVAGVAVVAAPIYGGVRLHKRIKRQKEYKRRQEDRQRHDRRIQELRERGDPYLEQWERTRRIRQLSRYSDLDSVFDMPMPSSYSSIRGTEKVILSSTAATKNSDREPKVDTDCDSETDYEENQVPSVHTSMAEIHSKL